MFEAAAAHSLALDADRIAEELESGAREQLGHIAPDAAIVFAAVDLDYESILAGLQDAFDGLQVIGATTDGEMSSVQAFQEDSTTAIFLASDTVHFATGVGFGVTESPVQAAETAVQQALEKLPGDPEVCVTTPEGLGPNSQAVLEALKDQLGEQMPIVGGLAGDQARFEGTYQFLGSKAGQDSLPILLMSGPVAVSHGVASGWTPLGERVEITRSKGNVLYELGGMTATEFYAHYLGEETVQTASYPLAIYEDNGEHFFLRSAISSNDDGSMTFFGDVPTGATAQITRAPRPAIIEATRESVQAARSAYHSNSPPAACLAFSCAGRHIILGSQTGEEADILQDAIAPEAAMCGFYTYGEIGPLAANQPSRFHNDTFITVLLGESA